MASLFRRSTSDDEVAGPGRPDQSEETIEVSAEVIAGLAGGSGREGTMPEGTAPEGTAPEPQPSELTVTEELLDQALLDQVLAERKSLVQLCLYALDRAKSPGVVERIEEGLASIGVAALRPDGDLFDPTHHEAGGTAATKDVTMDGVVAETEVVGFADRGRLLRAPIVIVYKAQQP